MCFYNRVVFGTSLGNDVPFFCIYTISPRKLIAFWDYVCCVNTFL